MSGLGSENRPTELSHRNRTKYSIESPEQSATVTLGPTLKGFPVIFRVIFIVVMLTTVTAACSSSRTVVSPTNFYGAYTPKILNYAATSGGVLVVVVGNPFEDPKTSLEQAITDAMTGSHFGPRVDFVTTIGEDFRSPYRVVIVFDSTQNYTPSKLCRQAEQIQPGNGEAIKAHAALCAGQKALTGVTGQVGNVSNPNDPTFRRLISRMTTSLLPPSRPQRRRGQSGVLF